MSSDTDLDSALAPPASPDACIDRLIGVSTAMTELKRMLVKIAQSRASTVLITGETGTGKDLVAKLIHKASERRRHAFMNITCSALPETLLESELFGHEPGAFTDAKRRKSGLFELARHGTVFLDEIGEMPPQLQAKLLRFLEEKSFKRVAGTEDLCVDVRVVAATNVDLEIAVERHFFRQDLYYRLCVLRVQVPPLRERKGDIPLLASHFIDRFNTEFGKKVLGVTPRAQERLESCGWPGNVRELKNALERAMLLGDRDFLDIEDFHLFSSHINPEIEYRLPPGGVDFERLERSLVRQALDRCNGNQTHAAALLGMSRDQIRYRIEKFDIQPRRRPNAPLAPSSE